MSHNNPKRQITWLACLVASLTMNVSAGVTAKEALPEVSEDGLQLQKDTKARAVYLKPGATISQYKRVALLDCYVEFAKDWEKDFNSDQRAMGNRVTTKDMDRIKAGVATEFKKIFTDELQKDGGYQVVDTAAPDVLVLRPAIINLAPTAPDLMTPGINRTIVESAGQMTLYLEFYDSVTSAIIARVIDPEADRSGMAQSASRVTNQAAADRILRRWATALRQHLDAVQAKAPGP